MPIESKRTMEWPQEAIPLSIGKAGRIEKLSFIYRNYNFIPTSGSEINDIIGLARYAINGEDTEDKLLSISNGALKGKVDPTPEQKAKALNQAKAVARRFNGFFREANGSLTHLGLFSENIAQTLDEKQNTTGSIDRDMVLSDAFEPNELPISYFIRHLDLRSLYEQGDTSRELRFDPLSVQYGPHTLNMPLVHHIDEVMEVVTLVDAYNLTDEAMVSEFERLKFWEARLAEARPFTNANNIGNLAIQHS